MLIYDGNLFGNALRGIPALNNHAHGITSSMLPTGRAGFGRLIGQVNCLLI